MTGLTWLSAGRAEFHSTDTVSSGGSVSGYFNKPASGRPLLAPGCNGTPPNSSAALPDPHWIEQTFEASEKRFMLGRVSKFSTMAWPYRERCFQNPRMCHQNIDHRELRDIFHHSPEDILFNNDASVEWNFAENPRQLARRIRDDANVCAQAQIGHDTIGNGWLELRIDIAGNQFISAFGKTHVHWREAV